MTVIGTGDDTLPEPIRRLLWDVDPAEVSLTAHREFLLGRVLAEGAWDDLAWLRASLGDDAIREQLRRTRGRRLSPRQLRFWEGAPRSAARRGERLAGHRGPRDLGPESPVTVFHPEVLPQVRDSLPPDSLLPRRRGPGGAEERAPTPAAARPSP